MGKTIIGKFVCFWIFILGGLFIARVLIRLTEPRETIIFIIVMSIVYWGMAFFKSSRDIKKGKGDGN